LLVEPCNPCPPKSQTISYCVPAKSCPLPCVPTNSSNWTCPQYVIYGSVLGGNNSPVELTNTLVNSYNMFTFAAPNELFVTLPVISSLNNYGKKFITIINTSSSVITIFANTTTNTNTDSINGYSLTRGIVNGNTSATLYSLPGISSGSGGSMWALTN
jgi:hypothetical protein